MQISEKSWTRGRPLRRRGTRCVASSSPRCSSRPCPTPTPPRPSPPPAGIPLTKLVVYTSAKEACSEATDTPGRGPEVPRLGQAPVVRRDAVEETVNVRKDEAGGPARRRRPRGHPPPAGIPRIHLRFNIEVLASLAAPREPPVAIRHPPNSCALALVTAFLHAPRPLAPDALDIACLAAKVEDFPPTRPQQPPHTSHSCDPSTSASLAAVVFRLA